MYFIGLDVHKKTISYCVKDAAGRVHQEGKIGSTRRDLDCWIRTLPQPRTIAMEATIFTGWIYDHLLPHAEKVKVAHPLMLRAIAAAKKKNDKIDAGKIADCLRCDFLPECHMASTEIRDRRRTLRYRNLVVRQMVQMKNRVSGLLMETGVSYNKQRLHKVGYFADLMSTNEEVGDSIRPLLKLSREMVGRSQKLDYALVSSLERDPLLKERITRLRTVPGVGPITALMWALEIGDFTRFSSSKQAISYCGLCGDEKSSADKVMRMPLSKQRNKHIQQVLIEAAKLAPRQCHELAVIHGQRTGKREPQPGHARDGQENGRLYVGGRAKEAGLRACRGVQPHSSSVRTFPNKEKTKISGFIEAQAARSRQLATGRRGKLRRPITNCFGTGREHKLNHL
jgi:transposase